MPRSSDSGFSSSEAAAMLQIVASAAECRWSVGCPRAAFSPSRSGQSGGKLAAARAGLLPAAAMENGLAASRGTSGLVSCHRRGGRREELGCAGGRKSA